jgi:lysophospholipase L1-like esterase
MLASTLNSRLVTLCAITGLFACAEQPSPAPEPPGSETAPDEVPPELARVAALAAPAAHPTARPSYVRVARTLDVFRSAEEIGANGSPVVNPCMRWAGTDCVETALHPFFRGLDGLAHVPGAAKPGHVRIVTFGNSMIASDNVTDVVRTRLQERFGDGGQGIVYVDELLYFGRRKWTGETDGGWYREYLTQDMTGDRPAPQYPLGIMGGHHVSHRGGAKTRWRLDGATIAKIHWLDHRAASGFRVRVDGKDVARVKPERGEARARILELHTTPDARAIEIVADGPRAVVYGATLEHPSPGVVFDTIGIVAASANSYLRADADVFEKQLRSRDPRLIVFMLGGNETRRIDRGVFNEAQVRKDFSAFVDRARAAAPDAACLTIGPLEAVWPQGPHRYEKRPYLDFVNRVERETSLEKGCAWFDFYAAMGGEGSVERFHKRGWMNDDLIHASGLGFDILGELVADALLDAYANERSNFSRAGALLERHAAIVSGQLEPGPGLSQQERGEPLHIALLGSGDRALFARVRERVEARVGEGEARLKTPTPCPDVRERGEYRGRRFAFSGTGCANARDGGLKGASARVVIDPGGAAALSARTDRGPWRNVLRRGEALGEHLLIDLPGGSAPEHVELYWRGGEPPSVVATLSASTGLTLDRLQAPIAPAAAAVAQWDLAIIFERDAAQRERFADLVRARERTACVVLLEPADKGPPEGCAALDIERALGNAGLKAAQGRGWLEDGRLTPLGASAVGEFLVHELIARPPTPVAKSDAADQGAPG